MLTFTASSSYYYYISFTGKSKINTHFKVQIYNYCHLIDQHESQVARLNNVKMHRKKDMYFDIQINMLVKWRYSSN
jgi:hypothetical protein